MKNKQVNIIIVDDEPHARNVLEKLVPTFGLSISIVASFDNLIEAVSFLKKNKSIDLVLLDIQMPFHAGYEIVNFFDEIFLWFRECFDSMFWQREMNNDFCDECDFCDLIFAVFADFAKSEQNVI